MTSADLSRLVPALVLGVAVVSVPVLVLEPEGLPRVRGLEGELHHVQRENEALRADVNRLRGEVRDLKDDPAAVERIAREQLGYVRKSEVVFLLPKVAQRP